jgi:hypothetical protein
MGRRNLAIWSLVATVVVVLIAAWVVYVVWRSPQRDALANFGSYAVAVVVGVIAVVSRVQVIARRRENAQLDATQLEHLADLLAEAVKDQWVRAASDRGLLQAEPIPVRWRKPPMAVTGPPSAAAGSTRFEPVPGMPAVSHQRLRGGRISDLHAVYGGLGSGRLVIIGAPGAGKSGAAVLLVLAALKHRGQVSAEDRQRVPIPVMFTMHGWDPRQQRVHDWLVVRLQQTYPLFAGRFGGRKAAAVLAAGKISVILDGLDEIPRDMRLVALRAFTVISRRTSA